MAAGDDKKKQPPYSRYAFLNAYNLSLLGAAGTVSILTGNWLVGVAAVGAEAIWMLFAPDSKLLRKAWFDKQHKAERAALEKKRLDDAVASLGPGRDQERCVALREKKAEIDRLGAENKAFTVELLSGELAKLDALVAAFVDMCVTCARYTEYLGTANLDELERDLRRYANIVDSSPGDDPRREVALKNLDVLQRRKAKIAEIRQYIGTARGQLDLIENSFRLLADQIMTMRSPQELSGQLDDLLDGVEAVRQTTRETDKLLQGIEH